LTRYIRGNSVDDEARIADETVQRLAGTPLAFLGDRAEILLN
jgi:hypothetical protein